jgi:uncharacterized OB-fold protein
MRDEDFFWEGVDQGRLLAQKCANCGTLRHPPAPMCSECQSLEWKAQELSGRGTIYSWLISKHPTQPDASPRTVVLVALEEGIRFVSNLAAGEKADIGKPVELYFDTVNGTRLPQFRLASGARK